MSEVPNPPAFTPVPSASARRDGWTPERQRAFINTLARIGLVAAAARAVGMSAKSAYMLRRRNGAESFAHAWDEAVASGRFGAEMIAIERALNGTVEPVFHRGKQVGERRRYNDRLLITVLKLNARDGRGFR